MCGCVTQILHFHTIVACCGKLLIIKVIPKKYCQSNEERSNWETQSCGIVKLFTFHTPQGATVVPQKENRHSCTVNSEVVYFPFAPTVNFQSRVVGASSCVWLTAGVCGTYRSRSRFLSMDSPIVNIDHSSPLSAKQCSEIRPRKVRNAEVSSSGSGVSWLVSCGPDPS